jgi:phage terminase small subunit
MGKELTKKHQVFVAEYLVSLDATSAAIKAGYSQKSAQSLGCQLLKHPKVSAEIAKKTGKRLNRLEITADLVLQELAKLAFLDPRKFYREDGSLKSIPELDDESAAALAGMEVEEAYEHFGKGQAKPTGVIKKIKFADKGQNLERLGRHLKLFTDKLEVTGMEGLADRINRARQAK